MSEIETSFLLQQEEIVPQAIDLQPYTGNNIASFSLETLNGLEDQQLEQDTSNIVAVKKVNAMEMLHKGYELALAIDPSQNGSGLAIYKRSNEVEPLTLVSSALTYDDKNTDPMRYFKMQQEFANDLLEFIEYTTGEKQPTFDCIIIEDTLLKHNPQIFKRLILINHVIDYLIGTEQVKTKSFLRLNNETWKKELRSYKIGKKYKTDKLDIEESLILLELPYALTNQHESTAWKDRHNYQDKLDAVGLLIAGLTLKDTEVIKVKRSKLQKITYEVVTTIPDKNKGYTRIDVKNPSANIEETLKALRKEETPIKCFIPFTSLGHWGIKNKIYVPDGYKVAYLQIEGE